MSLASPTNRIDYTGNGSVSTYSYTFKIFAATDLVVTVANTATPPVETTLALGVDYTVTGVLGSSGGSISLVNASQAWLTGGDLTNGYHLTIQRVCPLTQITDIRNQGAFFPEIHEDTFDRLVMLCQQLQEQLSRSLVIPITLDSAEFDPSLPMEVLTANGTLGINSSADGFAIVPPVGGGATFGFWAQEVPAGTINGSNAAFTLANTPIASATALLFLDGIFLIQGVDYTISGKNITMTNAPGVTQKLAAAYQH